jgi:DnaK suppressor protein
MDQATLDKIKQKLAEHKAQLERELKSSADKDPDVADNYRSKFPEFGDDEDENAAEVAAYSDQLSIEYTLEKQLRDVNKALVNIAEGTYGICKYCKNPIEEGRLLARPVSSSCVACKKKFQGET